jgi:predicted nucleic acid-binding protein
MTQYLLDTNIILRFCNAADTDHGLVVAAIAQLLNQGDDCVLTAQVLIEFWVVATRPAEVNGLGWTTDEVKAVIEQLLLQFLLLEESPEIFSTWLDFVSKNKIKGKRTHDSRIIAAMLTRQITHLLTLNPSDFRDASGSGIIVIHPQTLSNSQSN